MTIKRKALLGLLLPIGLAFAAQPAGAYNPYEQRDAAYNQAAIATLRNAEVELSSYFNANDTFGSSRGSLVKELNDANYISGGDSNIRFVVASRKSLVRYSGKKNNPNRVYIYGLIPGRFGGVLACVGSRGTKNYCTVLFGNAATRRYTLLRRKGQSNGVNAWRGTHRGWGFMWRGAPSYQAGYAGPKGPARWVHGLQS